MPVLYLSNDLVWRKPQRISSVASTLGIIPMCLKSGKRDNLFILRWSEDESNCYFESAILPPKKALVMDMLGISKWYEENPIARIIVNAIPYAGGSLDVALSSKWNKYNNDRIIEMLEKLEAELADLKNSTLGIRVAESEVFFDLIRQIAPVVTQSRCPETRTGYARIIRSALTRSESIPDLEDMVRQISDFREKDIICLRYLKQLYDSGQIVSGTVLSQTIKEFRLTPIEFESLLSRYENLGLLDHPRNRITGRGNIAFEKSRLFDKMVDLLGL